MTWDDDTPEEDDKISESEKLDASKEKFIAFMATLVSTTPVSSNDRTNQDVSESETEYVGKLNISYYLQRP